MTHPIVKTVATLVQGGDVEGAERALTLIADQEGDRALARIIDEMPPRDVVAILREHDASRMSIVGALVSPAQFAAAVALERDYGDRTHEALRGMINGVVFADESRTDEYIEALGERESGIEALCDYFTDRHEEIERFFRHGTFDPNAGDEDDEIPQGTLDLQLGEPDEDALRDAVALREVQDQDWRELGWRLRFEHYDLFREMLERLRGRHHRKRMAPPPRRAEATDEDDEDDVL